jgi:hypothetical protein
MPFVILPTNSASGGYDVTNSLRFNSGSSDKLNRTETAGNRRTYTFSSWIKKTFNNSSPDYQAIYDSHGTGVYQSFSFIDTNALQWYNNTGGYQLITTQLFRDVSAWYHIVVAVDTTQATASNRVRIYVNGSEVTSFSTSTYPAQNTDLNISNSQTMYLGVYNNSVDYFNGYLAETYFIGGTQLTPSSFGETDTDTGIWKPKAYTGTYGTNGFYLQFKNSASLGTDSSGNGNTFTVNNLTSVDQSTDTPTNNFATMNPLRQPTSNQATFTNGNLTVSTNSNIPSYYGGRSTMGVSSGKWYFEAKLVSYSLQTGYIGIQNTDSYTPELFNSGTGAFAGYSTTGWQYFAGNGAYTNNNTDTAYGNSFASGDIISVALDCDNAKLYFAKNGTYQNSGVPTSGATGTGAISITSALTYLFAVDDSGSDRTCVWDCNFGNPPYSANSYTDGAGYGNFSYAVPSGYYSLCTRNLANFG